MRFKKVKWVGFLTCAKICAQELTLYERWIKIANVSSEDSNCLFSEAPEYILQVLCGMKL